MSKTNPLDFSTIQEVIRYWRECLNQQGKLSDETIISRILTAGAFSKDREKWFEDEEFNILFEHASDLDWNNGTPEILQYYWDDMGVCLERLERRYRTK